eukprot:TRINITY_DN26300_c0_g1_i1.p1 TRINITY_DN26300_c0_g1~~TRINITY_DN26300_c0_g1_i1.p1  ORF type:complete len:402 (+),score=183.34 TRINITY_DN26300_c0_g1_i1:32-1207(+)
MSRTELLYKILIVGDVDVGKTSLVKRYAQQKWAPNTKPTIGVDFVLKELTNIASNTLIRVQLWDVAGQERFKALTRVYYKEAVAAVLVFDVTKHDTLKGVEEWKKDIDQKVVASDGTSIPCILLANKADLEDHIIDEKELLAFSKKHKFTNFFFTSAKTGQNVNEAMDKLVHFIYDTNKAKERTKGPEPEKNASKKLIDIAPDTTGTLRVYKLLMLGTPGAGKSCVLKRLTSEKFNTVHIPTTSLDVSTKTVQLEGDLRVNAQLWDLPAGKTGKQNEMNMKDPVGAMIVFDSTDASTLRKAKTLKRELDKQHPGLPCILLSNKIDLPDSKLLAASEVDKLCAEFSFINFYDTSAKTGQNIHEPFIELCQHIALHNPRAGLEQSKKKGGCCK